MGRILVVDDDDRVRDVVIRYLDRAGYHVDAAADGPAALKLVVAAPPDLVILDLMLPEMSGLEVCRELQLIGPFPVIMLTALGDEEDRVAGLEMGADDYITKPFSPQELVLRVKAVLRRTDRPLPGDNHSALVDGDLTAETAAHQVTRGGDPLALTVREYDLLIFLMQHPRTAFSREELLDKVWDWSFGDVSTVTVHIRRLREKIERDPANPERLVTVWGVGYRFEPGAAA